MSLWKERLYPYLPIVVQNLACSYHGYKQCKLRFGGEFRQLLDWLMTSEWWCLADIQEYQRQELRRLMIHVYEHVPYYRRIFDERKLTPSDIREAADLQKLPILTKEIVRTHFKELIAQNYPIQKMVHGHTSGSTATPLEFYKEPRAFQFRWAVWWRCKQRFGVLADSPYAAFTGFAAVPVGQNTPPYWREDYPMKQTVFSMQHITPEKVGHIVKRLNQGGFAYYAGYPSIIFSLANLILEQGLHISAPPKMIFTGAENLYENQRQVISQVFQCPVTDHYGFSEAAGNASRCLQDVFHEDFEYGILECDSPQTIGEGKVRGRIIGTGFSVYGMPFIRYDVGDFGVWSTEACSCGRHSQVLISIEGRTEDYVLTPEGTQIMRFDYIFKDLHNIREAQVVQQELGKIMIKIVRRPAYTGKDEEILRQEVQEKVSDQLHVDFEYVTEIPREPNGKFRAVRSLL